MSIEEHQPIYRKVSPVFHSKFLKVISPSQPILYALKRESDLVHLIVINHPKHPAKKAIIQARKEEFLIKHDSIKEISAIHVSLKQIDFKSDIVVSDAETLFDLKRKIICEIETLKQVKISDLLKEQDFGWKEGRMEEGGGRIEKGLGMKTNIGESMKKMEGRNEEVERGREEDEEKSELREGREECEVEKVKRKEKEEDEQGKRGGGMVQTEEEWTLKEMVLGYGLQNAFVGNVLHMNFRIFDQIKAYHLMTKLYIDREEEKMGSLTIEADQKTYILKTLIKFEKNNKKLTNKLLILCELDKKTNLILQEISGKENFNFPLDTIEFIERITNWQHEDVSQFPKSVRIGLKFYKKYNLTLDLFSPLPLKKIMKN